jgi:ubiquitin-like modifier-activating enzyme ATG7
MVEQVQFAPFKSFVDSSFFGRLSDKKLNEYRLDETRQDLYATYNVPIGTDKNPIISVSKSSFQSFKETLISSYVLRNFLLGQTTFNS